MTVAYRNAKRVLERPPSDSRAPAPHFEVRPFDDDRPAIKSATPTTANLAADAIFDDRRAARWAWYFVAVGIVLRLIRFALRFPLWGDEAFIAENVIRRDYAELVGALDHTQIAPVGYLWASRAMLDLFGTSEFSLRAAALVAGIAALVAFRFLAATLLRGTALVAAVGVLSVSYYPLRHAVEVKQYSCDLLAAVLLIWAGVVWHKAPSAWRLFMVAAAFVVCLPLSYPAVFVAGGVSIAMALDVWRRRSLREMAGFAAANLVLLTTFVGNYWLTTHGQWNRTGGDMQWHWREGFPPPLSQPFALVWWFIQCHTGETLAYPFGGDAPICMPQAIFVGAGIIALIKLRRPYLPAAFAGMLALALVAACAGFYPYGYGERIQQHWVPFVCLLLGAGVAALLARVASMERRQALARCGGALLLMPAFLWPTIDVVRPYKTRFDREHQAFARWFWQFASEGRPQVCLTHDLKLPLVDKFSQIVYTCYRETYRKPAEFSAGDDGFASILPGGPIDCVLTTFEGYPVDARIFDPWLRAMEQVYEPPRHQTYRLANDRDETIVYHVWTFTPRRPDGHLSQVEPVAAERRTGTSSQ